MWREKDIPGGLHGNSAGAAGDSAGFLQGFQHLANCPPVKAPVVAEPAVLGGDGGAHEMRRDPPERLPAPAGRVGVAALCRPQDHQRRMGQRDRAINRDRGDRRKAEDEPGDRGGQQNRTGCPQHQAGSARLAHPSCCLRRLQHESVSGKPVRAMAGIIARQRRVSSPNRRCSRCSRDARGRPVSPSCERLWIVRVPPAC